MGWHAARAKEISEELAELWVVLELADKQRIDRLQLAWVSGGAAYPLLPGVSASAWLLPPASGWRLLLRVTCCLHVYPPPTRRRRRLSLQGSLYKAGSLTARAQLDRHAVLEQYVVTRRHLIQPRKRRERRFGEHRHEGRCAEEPVGKSLLPRLPRREAHL